MDILPQCEYSLFLEADRIRLEGASTHSSGCDICVDSDCSDMLGFDRLPDTFYVAEHPCIFSVCRIPAYEEICWSHLQYIDRFMKQNRLDFAGNIQATVILNATDRSAADQRTRIFEIWVPVRDALQ